MHFDNAPRNAIELTRNQYARRGGKLLAQSPGEVVDTLQILCGYRGARRAHHADLYKRSLHDPLQHNAPRQTHLPQVLRGTPRRWGHPSETLLGYWSQFLPETPISPGAPATPWPPGGRGCQTPR